MSQPTKKVLQYLNEAHANELGLVRELESQIAITPRGGYRTLLAKHLRETRNHAERLQARMSEIGQSGNPFQAGVGAAGSGLAQAFAFATTPFKLLRGSGGEEKVLKNAKDACASEALEIATYTAIERLARSVGDQTTARLAASIRGDEEKMLARVLEEIPRLTESVVQADTQGNGSGDIAAVKPAVKHNGAKAKSARRQVRKAPVAKRPARTANGAAATAEREPSNA
jgi:ferritin-like metal-binding protein YciE